MLHRLRADFQLTILSLFGACAVAGLLPFAVYRFLTGALVVGLVDSFLVLGISAAVIYAWRTGDTRRPGLFMALVDTAGSITTATILGEPGRDWMYVALMSNFFLIDRRLAAIASVVALLITAISGKSFETPLHLI